MFPKEHQLADIVHNKLVKKRYCIPKLCYFCLKLRKKSKDTSQYCSLRCAYNHSIYLNKPLPVIPTTTGDPYRHLRMDGEGVYFIHKRTKVVLPEDQRVEDMKNKVKPNHHSVLLLIQRSKRTLMKQPLLKRRKQRGPNFYGIFWLTRRQERL